jgi:hypothetical protein
MAVSHSIFRQKALEQYKNRKEEKVKPRLISFSLVLLGWLVFALLCAAMYGAAVFTISEYEHGVGILQKLPQQVSSDGRQVGAVVFVPASPSLEIKANREAQLQIEGSERILKGTVKSVSPQLISPTEASRQYALAGKTSAILSRPSLVLFVTFQPPLPNANDEGKLVHFQLQTRSYTFLSLMLGSGFPIGGHD